MSSSGADQQREQHLPSFKEQLDYKARVARDPNYGKQEPQPTVLEKIANYAPSVGKLLGVENKEEQPAQQRETITGPPERPEHDSHIEEFLKDQHRSKKGENGQIIDS